MKVFLDAGHGGLDSGAVGVNGRMEKSDNLDMAVSLRLELIRRGHSVMMSRIGDTYPTLNERADAANVWGAGVFISLHRNSASPDANGGEVLYGPTASSTSIALAEELCRRMNTAAGFRHRGAKRQKATVLQRTKMPAVTVEAGFVTSRVDNAKYDSAFYPMICAIADSIEQVCSKNNAPVAAANRDVYIAQSGAKLYKYAGLSADKMTVVLEDYVSGDEYAKVSDGAGSYLVKWAELKKA